MTNRIIAGITLTIVFSFFTFSNTFAQKVSIQEADIVAHNWIKHIKKVENPDYQILSIDSVQSEGQTSIYRYQLEEGQFIWVSADRRNAPVLAYNLEPTADPVEKPVAYEGFLEQYSKEINESRNSGLKSMGEHPDWNNALKGSFKSLILENEVQPMMEVTWGQGGGYRQFTPDNTPTGCVAVAMLQIMKHWSYPEKGQGFFEYTHGTYGYMAVNFDTVDLIWDEMPYNEPNERIARLMYYAGIALHMNYDPAGSGAQTEDTRDILRDNFFYNPDRILSTGMSTYGRVEYFINMLKNELLNGRPVIVSGYGTAGHAFNFDGYQGDHFHVNWGWSGSQNGYFLVTSLTPGSHNFSESIGCISGIFPGDTMMVDRPSSLRLLAGHQKVNLAWYGLPQKNLEYYKIYRNGVEEGQTENTIFVDEGLSENETYTYSVSAVYNIDSIQYESVKTPEVFCPNPFGIVLPYEEDFEDGYQGWSIKGTSKGFNWGTASDMNMGNSEESKFIGINSGTAGANKLVSDTLVSNQIDLSSASLVKLSFDYILRQWQDIDHLYIMYRVFDEYEWHTFHELETTVSYNNWTNYKCYLPSEALHERVQLGFYYTDNGEVGYGAGIDNIVIEAVTDPGRPKFSVSERETCIGQEVVFSDESTGTRDSYYWDFGPGASPRYAETAGPHSVTYSSSGLKSVKLNLNGLDETEEIDLIEVFRAPKARFSKTINYKTVSFNNTSTDADAFIWDFGDGVRVTQKSPSHVYSLSGDYLVKLIAVGFICGNDTTENWINITITGKDDLKSEPEITVFPNPANGTLNISFKDMPEGNINIKVLSLTGSEILTDNFQHKGYDNSIRQDLWGIKPGIYFIRFESSKYLSYKKIIID